MTDSDAFAKGGVSLSNKTACQLSESFQKNALTPKDLLADLSAAIQSKDRDKRQIRAYINFDSM